MNGRPRRLWAGCAALSAFAVAIGAGLWADNGAILVLGRALCAMVLCYPLGLLAGCLCERVVESHREAVTDDVAMATEAEPAPQTSPQSADPDERSANTMARENEAVPAT